MPSLKWSKVRFWQFLNNYDFKPVWPNCLLLNDLQRAPEESPEEECQVNKIKKMNSLYCVCLTTKQSKLEQTVSYRMSDFSFITGTRRRTRNVNARNGQWALEDTTWSANKRFKKQTIYFLTCAMVQNLPRWSWIRGKRHKNSLANLPVCFVLQKVHLVPLRILTFPYMCM